MKFKSLTLITNHDDADLIASAMFDAGSTGVSILDKQDFLDLIKSDIIWDYVDENIINQTDDVKISGFFDYDDNDFPNRLKNELLNYSLEVKGEFIITEIDEADYENTWKKFYQPIQTKNITIVPTWIKYENKLDEKIIKLDPGMAFGTGSHPTTRMCLDFMDVNNKSVIDVGCGSGILGISASICGAKSVYMCDIDPQAVEFANENAKMNGVNVNIECEDLLSGNLTADFIFANITADILIRFSKFIGKHLNDNGIIVLSGIIDTRLEEVKNAYLNAGFEVVDYNSMDDWRALKLKKVV